jgi:hypothetical protein
MKKIIFLLLILLLLAFGEFAQAGDSLKLIGNYLGQKEPGVKAEIFAPGIVSNGMNERGLAITADGREIYFELIFGRIATIMVTRIKDGRWSEPVVAPFAADLKFFCLEPSLSADDRKILFLSNRPRQGDEPKPGWTYQHIWVAERQADGPWGEPYDIGAPINSTEAEFFPALTDDGTLYFTRSAPSGEKPAIWRSRQLNGKYQAPEPLPATVNGNGKPYNAFIARDESYLIACVNGRQDSLTPGAANYYIFFRSADDQWSAGVNLGADINFAGSSANAPYVSRNGKYFFFGSSPAKPLPSSTKEVTLGMIKDYINGPQNGASDVYWCDASVLKKLQPQPSK